MKNFVNTYKAQIAICTAAAIAAVIATVGSHLIFDELMIYALTRLCAVPPASVLFAACAYGLFIQAALLKTNDMFSFFSNGAMISAIATGVCLHSMDSVYRNPMARVSEIELLVKAELTLPYCIAITAVMVIGWIVTSIKAKRKQKGVIS